MTLSGYGETHELPISKVKAQALCDTLPGMGYEVTIRTHRWESGSTPARLVVQNISGRYCLASSSIERKDWPEYFDFHLESLQ